MADARQPREAASVPATSREGVDLTQIRALKAMTPTERVQALVAAVNNLERLKKTIRRV